MAVAWRFSRAHFDIVICESGVDREIGDVPEHGAQFGVVDVLGINDQKGVEGTDLNGVGGTRSDRGDGVWRVFGFLEQIDGDGDLCQLTFPLQGRRGNFVDVIKPAWEVGLEMIPVDFLDVVYGFLVAHGFISRIRPTRNWSPKLALARGEPGREGGSGDFHCGRMQ